MMFPEPLQSKREVHVWCVELAGDSACIETCRGYLSADEKERASRFRFDHLQAAFTLSKGVLRALLGRYLHLEPDRIRLAYGLRGKPQLAFPEIPLEFNLTHSGTFAAYAFAFGCPVGIDIEKVRPVPDQEDIVTRFFSPEECDDWFRLDASQREEGFFRCWTAKEAYIKAVGDGLSMPLTSFRVSFAPGASPRLVHAGGDTDASRSWSMCAVVPAAGYVGALALPESSRTVRFLATMTVAAVLKLADRTGPFPSAGK